MVLEFIANFRKACYRALKGRIYSLQKYSRKWSVLLFLLRSKQTENFLSDLIRFHLNLIFFNLTSHSFFLKISVCNFLDCQTCQDSGCILKIWRADMYLGINLWDAWNRWNLVKCRVYFSVCVYAWRHIRDRLSWLSRMSEVPEDGREGKSKPLKEITSAH